MSIYKVQTRSSICESSFLNGANSTKAEPCVTTATKVLKPEQTAAPLSKRQIQRIPNLKTLLVPLAMHILMTAFFVFLALMVLNPIVAIAIAAVGLLYGALMYRWWNMSKGQIDGQDSLTLSTFGSCLTANTATAIAWGAAGSIPLWAGIACPVLGIAGLVCIVYLNEKRARELAEQQKLQIQKN